MKDFLHIVTQIIIGVFIFNELRKRMDEKFAIAISIGCILLFYVHPIPLLYLTWKHSLPKETITKYILNFGLPYDVGKDSVIWKNIGGFDTTWVLDEQIKHTHPIDHIDFVYSTLKIPGIKPEHVCIISQATGSIFIDMLKQEATARCHYLVKNAVSLGFVQDVVAGKITMENSREEYGRRILNNVYLDWFKDPLNEAQETLGEGAHHLVITGTEHAH
tara:strand:+ start:97 stop:750 length:654 start_codon:yes stop_codon:yes gene_type:complete